ncbi:MAG: hypothetical protein CMG64_06875 [Candidatus Marinimicrobia bacterium]|nr:hypothetical protein [Candidatus Neomarinimicrobiota bacterium]
MDTKIRLPDFIGIGSPRCGTTFLVSLLKQHPKIHFNPYFKEIHFFDNNYHKGLNWYANFYKDISKNVLCSDFTPSYLLLEKNIKKIYEFNKNIKLVACFRDPIARTFSHYVHKDRTRNWHKDFFDIINDKDNEIVDYSLYGAQLKMALKYFPQKNIHIIIFEDLISNPQDTLSALFRFLEIQEFKVNIEKVVKNSSNDYYIRSLNYFIRIIRTLCRKSYYMRLIFYDVMQGAYLLNFIRKINYKQNRDIGPILNSESRKYLIRYFFKDKILLEKLIGRKITNWSF